MPKLDATGFVEFFQALWGKPPFAWQRELTSRVLADTGMGSGTDTLTPSPSLACGRGEKVGWPDAIALPTAAGKTACMDIAVYALAAQAGRLAERQAFSAPRRIFFVVDRRVIVDEAFERARALAGKLRDARDGIVEEVADRLRQLAGGDIPLAAHQLRGGMIRSDAWSKSPMQPMIVASTVDQLGSRLLFRAYGPGSGMRLVHAGLVGNDSLILLDEAHCALPFLETLQAVKRYRGWAETPLPSPFHVTVMSATPPEVADVFRDDSDDARDPRHPLGRRQQAKKPALLIVADKAKGKNEEVAREALAKALVEQALKLLERWNPVASMVNAPDLLDEAKPAMPAVVLFCNRVDTARRAYDALARQGAAVTLLTGRMRPIDKDDAVDNELAQLSVDQSETRRFTEPQFVVTTQTLEVGANLDFDLLVTECASLDALRQRFGRLNRMGRGIQAQAAIVVRADQIENSDDDPVYGASLAKTWIWLNRHADSTNSIDFGIAGLAPRLPDGENLAELNAPPPMPRSCCRPMSMPWRKPRPNPGPRPMWPCSCMGRKAGRQTCRCAGEPI